MKKTFLSIFFVLALCLCLSPTALATPAGTDLSSYDFTTNGYTLTGSNDAKNPAVYYLDADVTVNTTIQVTGHVALDLNGHVLKYENTSVKGSVITVGDDTTAGHLTLTDSGTSAKHYFSVSTETATAGLWIYGGDTYGVSYKEVTGGIITGGTGSGTYVNGGGVSVNKGSFTMSGGNIVGCTSTNGGGVYIDNNGTFNMSGGTISSCTATGGSGGGVYVSGGSLTMSGTAKIENCSATADVINNGGGVYVIDSGSFAMKGGTISSCTATGGGGGVYVCHSSSLTMSGTAKIESCSAADGGGVWVSESTFTMTGGSITGCSATGTDAKGGAVFGNGGDITITGPTEANKMLSIGGDVAATSCGLTVSGNVTVEGKLTVSNPDAKGLVRLSGGTFTGGIERTDDNGTDGCFALLPNDGMGDSYVYQQKAADAADWSTLENSAMKTTPTLAGSVRVVKCTHEASNNGACLYCGQGFVADVTKSGSTTLYPSLLQTLDAVKDTTGAEIKLLQDIDNLGDFELPAGTYTLDLNNYTLTCSMLTVAGDVTLKDSRASGGGGSVAYSNGRIAPGSLIVKNGGKLTLGTVLLGEETSSSGGKIPHSVSVESGGTLTVNAGCTINATVTVGGGTVSFNPDTTNSNLPAPQVTGALTVESGSVTINAGTFKGSISVAEGKTVASLLPARKIFVTGDGYQDSGSQQITPADGGAISVLPQPFKDLTVTAASGVTGTQNGGFSRNYGEDANFTVCATDILTTSGSQPVFLSGTYTFKQGETEKQTGSISTASPGTSWIAKASHFDGNATLAQAATLQISGSLLPAGSYTLEVKVTATDQSGYYETISVPVTVNKATMTAGTDYGTPDPMTGLTYNAQEQVLVSASAIQLPIGAKYLYSLDGTNWEENVSDIKGKDAKSYTVYWKVNGGDNYNDVTNTQPLTATIAPKALSATTTDYVSAEQSTTLTYTGQPQTPTFTVRLMEKNDDPYNQGASGAELATLTAGTDYTVTVTPQTNVGNYELTITGKGNYTGTKTENWSINKADYGTPTANGSAKFGAAGTVELSNLIMPGGTAEVTNTTDTDSVLNGAPGMNGTTLQFTFANDAAKAGKAAVIEVSVTGCTNYNDYTITVTVTVTEKNVPTVTANSITKVYDGEPVPAGAITGTATFNGQSVAGSWSFTNAGTFTAVSDSDNSVSVTFTPTDTETYAAATATIKVTINKATPTGAPTYTAITTSGKKLSDANLQIGTITPAGGAIAWELSDDTEVTANTAYNWTYTPTDSTNYNTLSGSITLYRVSAPSGGGGGGSSSGSTSSSTTVTVPVTSESSSVSVKAEVSKEGTATVEISDKQIEEVAQHGSGTVTVDVSGLKNVESVQVPAHVVESTNKAEGTGLTVALPAGSVTLDETALESVSGSADVTVAVQQVSATDLTEAQQKAIGDTASIGLVVDVDLFVGAEKQSTFNGGTLTISVPYTPKSGEDTSKLTVWFIRDDGTIENKGGYYDAEKKCFVFETAHLSRYVLVYNDKAPSFTDVAPDAYYAAAVNWAVAQNITDGIGGGKFGPDLSCTRAQIVTFLYRCAVANGVDVTVGEETNILSYADALEIPEYAVAPFQWAVGAGIIQGADGKLMPNDDCTRVQIVTMLYRYEAANGMDFVTLQELVGGFADASEVPGYALSAFNWALGANIIQGANGKLMPNDPCTRAQIVTMLYRLLGE